MNFLNRKNWVTILFIGFVIILAIVGSTISVIAQDLNKITYPVADLGNCANQQECKAYCSVSDNYSKCAAFAKKIGLDIEIPLEQRAILEAMQKGEGPGQCKDEASCRNYCEDIDHIEECISFVEKFNLASGDELKEIRKMADVKKAGVAFPGYCNNNTNVTECVNFAEKAGFMTKEDADMVRKAGGKGPGNCGSREACDSYCKDETHIDECVDFAVRAGLISAEDAEMAKRFK